MLRRNFVRASASVLAFLPAIASADPASTSGAGPSGQLAAADPQAQQTIIVTASPIIGNPDRFASIVSQVGRSEILEHGGGQLADALANIPGVSATGFAAGASRPVIRGFDSNRVRILEDGVGSFDVSDIGPDHGVPIDPLAAQDIEVVRGAATLRYGSQAIGGVVNAINNRVPTSLPDEPFSGDATSGYSSVVNGGDGSLLADGRIGQLALHADGSYRHANSYDTPEGRQDNSFFRGDAYSAGGSYFFDPKDRIGAAFVHYDATYGVPSDITFINMRQTKGLFRSSFDIDEGPLQTLTVDGGYANYRHTEVDPVLGPQDTFNDKEWDVRAETVLGKLGPLSASSIGFQAQNRDFSALDAVGGGFLDFMRPATTKTFAGFGFAEAPLGPQAHLQFGARIEHVEVDGTPISDVHTAASFTPVSGSAGVLYDVTQDVKLGLTLSSAARAPANTELFARGPHDGPNTFEVGDPSLKIERANSAEATLRVRKPGFDLEGSAWGVAYNNFIFGDVTGDLCDDSGVCDNAPGNDLKQLFYRQHDATFYGAEAKASVPLADALGGTISADMIADVVRAEFTGNLGNVPRIPPYHVGGGLSFDADAVDGGFLLTYSGRQDETATNETPTKSFISLDANLAWRPFSSRRVEIALAGHNLTDSVQRSAVSINKDEIILPGRDVRIVLRVPL